MTMSVKTKKGEKVLFLSTGGYFYQLQHANKFLVKNEIYTVHKCDFGKWHSNVYLEEVPGISFSASHFVNVDIH